MPKPEDTGDNITPESQETTPATDPSGDETQPKPKGETTYTEAQYKGLQAVIAKRDATIAKLTNQISELEAELAEERANHGKAVSEKTNLSSKFTETEEKKAALEKEVADLQKKVSYQTIIMTEFPDLAPMSKLIPPSETEDGFRDNAKELRKAMKQYADTTVTNVLSGSSISVDQNGNDGTTLGNVDELDKLYKDATALAGVPGKEAEYREKYDRYLQLFNARNKQQ